MSDSLHLAALAAFVFTVNLPFGYWRHHTRKLSPRWFAALHLPVPVIVVARMWSGWGLVALLLMVPLFFAGQRTGAIIARRRLVIAPEQTLDSRVESNDRIDDALPASPES